MARHLFLKCISRSALSSAVSSSLCVSCALISFILFLLNKREKRSLFFFFFFYFINQVDVFNPSRWNGDRKTCLHYFTCFFFLSSNSLLYFGSNGKKSYKRTRQFSFFHHRQAESRGPKSLTVQRLFQIGRNFFFTKQKIKISKHWNILVHFADRSQQLVSCLMTRCLLGHNFSSLFLV